MTFKNLILSSAFLCGTLAMNTPAQAGTDVYMGEITAVGFNFCPRGYSETSGQLLAISQYQALFSLLGTMYGGDGRTTFGLPNLQGRVAMGSGNGAGLTPRNQGAKGGTETNTMTVQQMPAHTHRAGLRTINTPATQKDPTGMVFADTALDVYGNPPAQGHFMDESTLQVNNEGGGQAQNNIQPFLALKYCIATQGIYPSRN